ncbi:hypothetical protein Tco_0189138 [Tanacetum coccineum]
MSGNSTITTIFHIKGDVNPSPVIATYNLTSVGIQGHPISIFARSLYSIFETDSSSASVEFYPIETIVPQKDLCEEVVVVKVEVEVVEAEAVRVKVVEAKVEAVGVEVLS